MAELHPDADVTDGRWVTEVGGTILNTSIDELVINDADYIRSAAMPDSDVCEVAVGDPGGAVSQPMSVVYRYKNGGVTGTANLTVTLLQGAVEIANWEHSNVTTTFATATQTLTSAQFLAISDFTNLRLRFNASFFDFISQRDGMHVVQRDDEQTRARE